VLCPGAATTSTLPPCGPHCLMAVESRLAAAQVVRASGRHTTIDGPCLSVVSTSTTLRMFCWRPLRWDLSAWPTRRSARSGSRWSDAITDVQHGCLQRGRELLRAVAVTVVARAWRPPPGCVTGWSRRRRRRSPPVRTSNERPLPAEPQAGEYCSIKSRQPSANASRPAMIEPVFAFHLFTFSNPSRTRRGRNGIAGDSCHPQRRRRGASESPKDGGDQHRATNTTTVAHRTTGRQNHEKQSADRRRMKQADHRAKIEPMPTKKPGAADHDSGDHIQVRVELAR